MVVYDYLERMTKTNLRAVNRELIDLVKKERPKYVVWPTVNYEFLESTFDAIRKWGTILVGLFFDDEYRFDNYSKYWIPHLDYCVTSEIETVPKYRELGARVIHAIPCHGVPIERDWSDIEEKYEVSFVGTRKYDRETYINQIKEHNIRVHVVGPGWDKWASSDEISDIFKCSKINLNFSKTEHNKLGWKGRIFQITNAGGFLLTEYRPRIENFFEIDKEIVCFRDGREMVDKILYYLNNDKERRAIAQAGWKRATSQYTPFHMMSRIFDEIESDFAANGRKIDRHSEKLKMPMQIRRLPSQYYMLWGRAFLLANYSTLWRAALAFSICYYPLNRRAWRYYVLGFLPFCARTALIRHYEKLCSRFRAMPPL